MHDPNIAPLSQKEAVRLILWLASGLSDDECFDRMRRAIERMSAARHHDPYHEHEAIGGEGVQ